MITFKKLTVKNFLGFGEIPVDFDFDFDGTTLISGHNGAGKTSIINALVYTLYDKPLSNGAGKKDALINNVNKKRMETSLEFSKNGVSYVVTRARKMKTGSAGNYVLIYENGKDVTPDSITNGNILIESIIGIPYDLFIRIVAISATYVPFLELPVKTQTGACQTDIIEELFDLKSLTTKANILKEQIKETKHSLDIQNAKREALEEEKVRHVNQIETVKKRMDRWKTDTASELKEVTQLLKHAMNVDVDSEKETLEEIETLSSELHELSPTRKDIRIALRDYKRDKADAEAEIEHLKDGKCPYCKQSMDTAKEKLAAAKKILKICVTSIGEGESQVEELDKQIDAINEKIEKLEKNVSVNSVQELYKLESKIDKYASKIEDLKSQENPHTDTLNELLEINQSDFNMESINELDVLLKHQNMVLKLLTKKDSFVRKNLINKSIPYLNKRLNHYLHELQLPQSIEFKHDMTASVSKFGKELDFGNLSNGQKARVNLAMAFAFRDVLQNLHGQINICLLDEVLDVGLDAEGAGHAADMLNRKGREEEISIYVVSHKSELESIFDRTIKVELIDDFTHISYDV